MWLELLKERRGQSKGQKIFEQITIFQSWKNYKVTDQEAPQTP